VLIWFGLLKRMVRFLLGMEAITIGIKTLLQVYLKQYHATGKSKTFWQRRLLNTFHRERKRILKYCRPPAILSLNYSGTSKNPGWVFKGSTAMSAIKVISWLFSRPFNWNKFSFYNPKNGLYFKEVPEEIHTIELPKVPAESDGSAGWGWLRFLRSKRKEEFEMVASKNPEIRQAVNTLYGISADALARAEYEARQKARRDYISGMEGAIRQGRQEEKMDTARNALAQGLPLDLIQKITGLPPEEIKRL
jgi:hypothetical protein